MPETIKNPAAYSPTAPSTGSGMSVSASVHCGKKATSASSAAATRPMVRAVERVAYTRAMLAELMQVGKAPASPSSRSPRPLAWMPLPTACMSARFQSASSILSSMMTLPRVSSWVRMATRATATSTPASRCHCGATRPGQASSGAWRRTSVSSMRPSRAARATPTHMATNSAIRRRRPPHTDNATMQPSVMAAISALGPSSCHWPASMPSAWRTELATSAMPPMQITTPTTGGGNRGRMKRASGTMARATRPYTSAAGASAPRP